MFRSMYVVRRQNDYAFSADGPICTFERRFSMKKRKFQFNAKMFFGEHTSVEESSLILTSNSIPCSNFKMGSELSQNYKYPHVLVHSVEFVEFGIRNGRIKINLPILFPSCTWHIVNIHFALSTIYFRCSAEGHIFSQFPFDGRWFQL